MEGDYQKVSAPLWLPGAMLTLIVNHRDPGTRIIPRESATVGGGEHVDAEPDALGRKLCEWAMLRAQSSGHPRARHQPTLRHSRARFPSELFADMSFRRLLQPSASALLQTRPR